MHMYRNIQVGLPMDLSKNGAWSWRAWVELVDVYGVFLKVIGWARVCCRQRIVICCLPHFGLCLHGLLAIKSVE
jgi:hypothetical protein